MDLPEALATPGVQIVREEGERSQCVRARLIPGLLEVAGHRLDMGARHGPARLRAACLQPLGGRPADAERQNADRQKPGHQGNFNRVENAHGSKNWSA